MLIKVGFCVAYDWYFLKQSLPQIYESADSICISIDKNRRSWAGKYYEIDEEQLRIFLIELDTKHKVTLYEDDFFDPILSPMQNEIRQRNMMAASMGTDGWHVQLDSDEFFIDFDKFALFLKNRKFEYPVNINCPWITLYKKLDNSFLVIENIEASQIEFIPVATNLPHYEHGRRNGYFNIKTNYCIVHQSWARSESEILQKIQNWGHLDEFDIKSYYEFWKNLNEHNYLHYFNFHPIVPEKWSTLKNIEADSISELITYFSLHPMNNISKTYLWKENSRWFSRLNSILKKIIK